MTRIRSRNLINNQFEQSKRKIELSSRPLFLELDLTNKCNSSCLMCYRRFAEPEPCEMDPSVVDCIKKFFPFLFQLKFGIRGEPLMYPGFNSLLEAADNRIPISLITNLQVLDSGHIRTLKKRKGIINVSFDAASEGLYRRIRGNSLTLVIENVRRIKAETKLDLWLNMTVFMLNFPEAGNFLELCKKLDVNVALFQDLLYFNPEANRDLINANQIFPLSMEEKAELNRIILKSRCNFKIFDFYNMRATAPALYSLKNNFRRIKTGNYLEITLYAAKKLFRHSLICEKPWERLTIECDGKVSACDQQKPFGDLNTQSLEEIWNCGSLLQIRRDIVNGIIPDACKNCRFIRGRSQWITRG